MWSSRSPNVTLFLQLCKTSCGTRTDIPHVFFSFCDSACSNCLHPFSLPLSYFSLFSYPPCHLLCLSPSQIWLITWQWTTSPSRSSCWPLAWPRPGSEASPHLLLRCGGATWSRRSLWRLLCSCSVVTDRCTHTFPLFNRNSVELEKLFGPDVKFSGSLKEAWTTNNATYLIGTSCFIWNHWMFLTTH